MKLQTAIFSFLPSRSGSTLLLQSEGWAESEEVADYETLLAVLVL